MEVSDFLAEPPSTLRYWEKEFPDYIRPIRNAGKIRYYTPGMIEQLKMIKYLVRERGMKLEAVREELRLNKKNVSKRMKILQDLEDAKSQLLELQAALKKRR